TNIKNIQIPTSVSKIGNSAFSARSDSSAKLENIYFYGKQMEFGDNVFEYKSTQLTIHGYKDSAVHTYASNNQINFEPFQFEWIVDGNEVMITGYNGNETDITIPEEIDGMPVTVIGDGVFADKGLTSVILPTTLKEIGPYAFALN